MNFIFIILGILGLIWCMVPKFLYGVLNIGNITGLIVFMLFLLAGIFNKRLKTFIKNLKEKKAGKIALRAVGALMALIVFFVVLESICMLSAANNAPEGDETLVVLGSYVNRAGPSTMAKTRLDAAYDHLLKNPDAKCIVTGGQGKDEPWPEADSMYDYLVEKGIEPDRIYKERESANSRENLLFAKNIIEKEGLNENIVIVSNEFHLYRAGRIAKRLGIEFKTLGSKTPAGMFSSFYIRELYAILADWFIYSWKR